MSHNFHFEDHRDHRDNGNNIVRDVTHLIEALGGQRHCHAPGYSQPECLPPIVLTNIYAGREAGPYYTPPIAPVNYNEDYPSNPYVVGYRPYQPAYNPNYPPGPFGGYRPYEPAYMPADCPPNPWHHMPPEGGPHTWPEMGPRTYTDHRGGEFTVEHGRITDLRDDAGRCFSFGYDQHTRQVNYVRNEDGEWDRGCGDKSNLWTKRGTHGKVTWSGDVTVGFAKDSHGREQPTYSFDDGQTKYSYTLDGVKSAQSHYNGEPYEQISTDAHGVTTTHDFRNHFTKRQDHDGHIMGMTMDLGPNHSVNFSEFDENGHCGKVVNGHEVWQNTHGDEWTHSYIDNNHKMRTDRIYGQMNVNPDEGSYTWNDNGGRSTTWRSDSSVSTSYEGNTMVTRPDNTNTGYDINGNEFPCAPINGSVRYDVRNGVTVKAHLHVQGAEVDSDGNIKMEPQAPINAFERGHCVYSSGDKERTDSALLPQDWRAIKNLESHGKNIVIVQTADGRYDVYSGLGRAVPRVGEWLEKNTIIGQADDSGIVKFGVRRQHVGGEVVPVSGS